MDVYKCLSEPFRSHLTCNTFPCTCVILLLTVRWIGRLTVHSVYCPNSFLTPTVFIALFIRGARRAISDGNQRAKWHAFRWNKKPHDSITWGDLLTPPFIMPWHHNASVHILRTVVTADFVFWPITNHFARLFGKTPDD